MWDTTGDDQPLVIDPTGLLRRRGPGGVTAAIAVATPIASWWLIGDLRAPRRPGAIDAEFGVQLPPIPGGIVTMAGLSARTLVELPRN